jgi:hypothetical protein
MKTAFAVCLGASALTVTACVPPHSHHPWGAGMKVVSSLECPSAQGQLKLKSEEADHKSCLYAGDDGSEVKLMLLPVSGDPDSVLSPIEAELKTQLPEPPAPPASSAPPAASAPTDGHKDVNISLPGISIHAVNDQANIRVGGLRIDADGPGDNVHVGGPGSPFTGRSGFSVDANNQGAVIRMQGHGPDVRSTLILASHTPGPQGWKVVGYDARGPRSGPLVVATVKSKADEADDAMGDAERLVLRSFRG